MLKALPLIRGSVVIAVVSSSIIAKPPPFSSKPHPDFAVLGSTKDAMPFVYLNFFNLSNALNQTGAAIKAPTISVLATSPCLSSLVI